MKLFTPALGFAWVLALTLSPIPDTQAASKPVARGINQIAFGTWTEALQLESKDAAPKAVVVPAFGGRVLSYGFRGESILWNPTEAPGADAGNLTNPAIPGGFLCLLGPDSAPPANQGGLANGRYDWSTKGRSPVVILKSPEDKSARASIEREVMFDPSTGDLGFVHRLKNLTDQDGAFTLSQRIACQPGGFVLFPLSKKSRFAAGWAVLRENGGRTTWDGANPTLEGVRVLDGVLVAKTGTGNARIGADSDAQWMAYVVGRTMFILHFPFYASAVYAEGGNSVTCSWSAQNTELQPIGPEARLRSRRTSELPMKWSLVELPAEITKPEQARALADKVPASPFL
jgi:hypothetical protein